MPRINAARNGHREFNVTDYQVKELAHRVCWKYKMGDKGENFTFDVNTLLEFARLLKLMEDKK